MTPQDMAAIHRLAMRAPPPWSAADIAATLSASSVFAVCADRAFAIGRIAADEVELLTLAVHPDARRRGRGRDLLDRFHAEASRRAAREAFLEVAAGNLAARALYAQAGYRQIGIRPGYCVVTDGCREDALVLSRALDAAPWTLDPSGA